MPNEFVIFCTARTGSYSLVSRLNSVADIVCHGEIFKRKVIEVEPERKKQLRFTTLEERNAEPIEFIRDLRRMDPDKIFGFKFFGQHQNWANIGPYLRAPETKRVILYRDPVAVYGSLLRAKSSGQWVLKEAKAKANGGATVKAHFTPESYESFISGYASFAKKCVNLSKLPNTFVIDYRQINDDSAIDELLQFLGSSARFSDTATELTKQNPGSDEDGFDNWDEFEVYLKTSPHQVNGPHPTCG